MKAAWPHELYREIFFEFASRFLFYFYRWREVNTCWEHWKHQYVKLNYCREISIRIRIYRMRRGRRRLPCTPYPKCIQRHWAMRYSTVILRRSSQFGNPHQHRMAFSGEWGITGVWYSILLIIVHILFVMNWYLARGPYCFRRKTPTMLEIGGGHRIGMQQQSRVRNFHAAKT